MRLLLCLLSILALGLSAPAKEFKLYAAFNEDTEVDMANGSKWVMDKGEVFPVLMYKEMQTKIVLELADTTFRTDTPKVRLLKNDELGAGLAKYQKSVDNYLRTKAEKPQKPGKKKKSQPSPVQ